VLDLDMEIWNDGLKTGMLEYWNDGLYPSEPWAFQTLNGMME